MRLTAQDLTVASDRATVRVAYGSVKLTRVVLAARDGEGGTLVLRESDALLRDVAIEVPNTWTLAIDGHSGIGNDLWLSRVSFHGRAGPSRSKGWVYALNYGTVCVDCRIVRNGELGERFADRFDTELDTGAWPAARWPAPVCRAPNEADELVCAAQCPEGHLVQCAMRFDAATELCTPQADCVPPGEITLPHRQ